MFYLDDGVTIVRKSLVQGAELIAAVSFNEDNQGKINIIQNFLRH